MLESPWNFLISERNIRFFGADPGAGLKKSAMNTNARKKGKKGESNKMIIDGKSSQNMPSAQNSMRICVVGAVLRGASF